MEFLVHIAVSLPADMDLARRDQLVAAERVRGRELIERGTIVRIWRIPGTLANYGIWQGADADEVHAAIAGLPLFPYFGEVEVIALATHPLEAGE
jgi:muconolactone D-isomerase